MGTERDKVIGHSRTRRLFSRYLPTTMIDDTHPDVWRKEAELRGEPVREVNIHAFE